MNYEYNNNKTRDHEFEREQKVCGMTWRKEREEENVIILITNIKNNM